MDNFFIKKYPCLENKNFKLLLSSQLLSQSGGYIQNVALSVLITEFTGSRMRLGIFLCVAYAPVFLFSYFAGKIASNISAKTLLILTEFLLLSLSVVLLIAFNMSYGWFLVFGAVWGTVRAFQTPAAGSMPKLLCESEGLHSAVTSLSLTMSVARAAGPIISGVLYTMFSYRAAFFANALSYIPSLIFLFRIKNVKKLKPTVKASVKIHLNYYLLAVVFTISLVGTAYNIIFTGLSQKLELQPVWFSVFMGLIGVGAIVGALIMSKPRKTLWACLGISVCTAILAVSKSVWLICIIALVYGLSDYLFFTCALERVQRENDEQSITRAMGIYTIVTTGALPLGFLILGLITQQFSISVVLGAISAVCAGIYLIFSSKFIRYDTTK